MALTREKIHAVITEIHGKTGEVPTQTALRKALGGGSFGTIGDALNSWREEFNQEAELAKVVLPSHLEERLRKFGAELWGTSVSDADARLAADWAALKTAKQDFETREKELLESISTLEDEADQACENIRELKNKLEEAASDRRVAETNLSNQIVASKATEKALREQLEVSNSKFDKLLEKVGK